MHTSTDPTPAQTAAAAEPAAESAGAERSVHVDHHARLSEQVQQLLVAADGRPISIDRILSILGDNAQAGVLLILCLPFVVPVPTMGLSAPVGLAVAAYGLCVMLHVTPWVPKMLRRRELAYSTLERLVRFFTRFARFVERFSRPRFQFMHWPIINAPVGFCLILCGVALALPLPIPFTNAIPAVAIILLLVGHLESDGVATIAGLVVVVAVLAMLYMLAGAVGTLVDMVTQPSTRPAG